MNLKKINFDELKEITEPQIFDPPRKLLVWSYRYGEPENVREADVVAILPSLPYHANILCAGSIGITWATHCAEIPKEKEPRKATFRELAKWLAQGNGEIRVGEYVRHYFFEIKHYEDDVPSFETWKVRKWDDKEWHEPTIDYLGIN